MVYEMLLKGEANAISGKELAEKLNCNLRDITAQIERERRAGFPICAAARGKNGQNGYFIAETPEELNRYCEQIKHRAIELFITRQALVKVLKKIAEEEQAKTDDK